MSDFERVCSAATVRDTIRAAVLDARRAIEAMHTVGPRTIAVSKLCPDAATVEQFLAAGGSRLWLAECDACGAFDVTVVTVGKVSRHESAAASLCRACVLRALDAIDAADGVRP